MKKLLLILLFLIIPLMCLFADYHIQLDSLGGFVYKTKDKEIAVQDIHIGFSSEKDSNKYSFDYNHKYNNFELPDLSIEFDSDTFSFGKQIKRLNLSGKLQLLRTENPVQLFNDYYLNVKSPIYRGGIGTEYEFSSDWKISSNIFYSHVTFDDSNLYYFLMMF